jgi:hypothetical protein
LSSQNVIGNPIIIALAEGVDIFHDRKMQPVDSQPYQIASWNVFSYFSSAGDNPFTTICTCRRNTRNSVRSAGRVVSSQRLTFGMKRE